MKPKFLFYLWCEPKDDFFRRVEEYGGWPFNAKWVGTRHGCEVQRVCTFTDLEVRDEWYTSIYSADDYYEWKLSPERRQKIKAEARNELIGSLRMA
jgi:hypothetical protein